MAGLGVNPTQQSLHVQIVGLAFRPGYETKSTFEAAVALDPCALCAAIVPGEVAPQIKSCWQDSPERRLLIAGADPREAAGVAIDLLNTLPPGPLAILLANTPETKGFLSLLPTKAASELINGLLKLRPDVQVVPYSPSWPNRLPRIR